MISDIHKTQNMNSCIVIWFAYEILFYTQGLHKSEVWKFKKLSKPLYVWQLNVGQLPLGKAKLHVLGISVLLKV